MATQEQIAKWASEVIPREKAALDIAAIANEDMASLLAVLVQDRGGLGCDVPSWVAKIAISLFCMAERCNFDLMGAIEREMI